MRTYIKENNSFLLFFIHLLLPILEIIVVINASGTSTTRFLASTFSIIHIFLISLAYKKSLSGPSLNYILSLGETRIDIYKDLISMYVREILFYTIFMITMLVLIQPSNVLIYIITRLIFSLAVAPIFFCNSLVYFPVSLS